MNEDSFNNSLRGFLKKVGINFAARDREGGAGGCCCRQAQGQ
ncbi:MAG: DUF6494 family protein [Bradyrhizobium sp.]|nr:DUF6494 family protein [Bradyrhizobium sp.]